MNAKHHTNTCQGCQKEYTPTINKDGSLRATKYKVCSRICYAIVTGRRTKEGKPPVIHRPVHCAMCNAFMGIYPPGQAKRMTYCSRSCSSKRQQRTRPCDYCLKEYISTRNNRSYCSNSCSQLHRNHGVTMPVKAEIDGIRRIKQYAIAAARKKDKARDAVVIPEIKALLRIAAYIRAATRQCSACGITHIRRARFIRTCSMECHQANAEAAKQAYKDSPATKRAKRIAKSRRRAIIRGCKHTENIDPIRVFDRDGWMCHICGIQTKREDRGGTNPEAPEIDHIIPIAMGGTHTWDNVACACRGCNMRKGARWAGSSPEGVPLASNE